MSGSIRVPRVSFCFACVVIAERKGRVRKESGVYGGEVNNYREVKSLKVMQSKSRLMFRFRN